jgi:aryl carrier-like protein
MANLKHKVKVKVINYEKLKQERRLNKWKKKGYDVDNLQKISSEQKQIEEWKKKGYDVEDLQKNLSKKQQIEEWKKKGYDVDAIEDSFKNNKNHI